MIVSQNKFDVIQFIPGYREIDWFPKRHVRDIFI